MIFVYSLGIYVHDVTIQWLATYNYVAKLGAKYYNCKQNIEHNRLGKKELPERKIGEKKSKIGSSLVCTGNHVTGNHHMTG